jgi:hypothetical protein
MKKLLNNLIFKILVVTACTAAFDIKKICFFLHSTGVCVCVCVSCNSNNGNRSIISLNSLAKHTDLQNADGMCSVCFRSSFLYTHNLDES